MQSVRTPLIIEPSVNTSRYVTGILPPTFDGAMWHVPLVEERTGTDGKTEIVIVDRFILTPDNLRRVIWTAIRSVRVRQLLTGTKRLQ